MANFHFLQFQKWPKINFWTGKKFKNYQKCNFTKKKLIYLISRVFLPGLFLDFLARCVTIFKKDALLYQACYILPINNLVFQKYKRSKERIFSHLLNRFFILFISKLGGYDPHAFHSSLFIEYVNMSFFDESYQFPTRHTEKMK